jgi:hypothetical protein
MECEINLSTLPMTGDLEAALKAELLASGFPEDFANQAARQMAKDAKVQAEVRRLGTTCQSTG